MLSRKVEGLDPLKPWQPSKFYIGVGAKFYFFCKKIDNTIHPLRCFKFLFNIFL